MGTDHNVKKFVIHFYDGTTRTITKGAVVEFKVEPPKDQQSINLYFSNILRSEVVTIINAFSIFANKLRLHNRNNTSS